MSRRKIILADFTQAKKDERGVDIETPNGDVFSIDPPLFWPDDFGEKSKTGDNRIIAAAILGGDEQMAKFEAAGGTANMLMAIVNDVMLSGVNAGE